MNKTNMFLLCAGLGLCSLSNVTGQVEIRVLTTFDFPGQNNATPKGISNTGDVVGTFVDRNGITRGFLRDVSGSFPRVADLWHENLPTGINTDGVIVGYVYIYTLFNGFILADRLTYIGFGGNNGDTYLFGNNDDGDYVGSFQDTADTYRDGVGSVNGIYIGFKIPGADFLNGNGINNLDEIVGEYYDPPLNTTAHGYVRAASTRLTYPIDYPGAASTILLGINDNDLIVGRWVDDSGVEHGLLHKRPDTFISFDYPGASGTSLSGINNAGFISGRYTDSWAINHGFLARVR